MIIALFAVLLTVAQAPAPGTSASQPPKAERIGEIRVHGNVVMQDQAVIDLAGVTVGSMLDAGGLLAIQQRLKASGRFDEVDVRKRYRTLEMDDVALLIVVHEKPGVGLNGEPPNLFRRVESHLIFFPIVYYEDGYGWTYGARTTIVNIFDKRTRVTVPLSWGASKTGTVEIDRTFTSGPFTRVTGIGGIEQNHNPGFHVDDRRAGGHVRAERRMLNTFTVGGELGRSNIDFGAARDHTWITTLDAKIDTRRDPLFPTNSVFASATWSHLNDLGASSFGPAGTGIDMYSFDARGYKRLYRQSVFAVHAHWDFATAPLPQYDQWLLGGDTLRGTDPGEEVGDRRFFWSAEARVPFTAPMNLGRFGFDAFIDGGAAAPYSQRLEDQHQIESVGAGVWVILAVIPINFDVAHSLNGQGTRLHFSTGFTF